MKRIPNTSLMRVVIADDHHLIRQGLRHLLARERDMQVVAEAADGQDAIDIAGRVRPDVVVMDVEMPVVNGIEATNRICQSFPETQLVMLSMYSDPALIRKARERGARGYVLKQSVSEELVSAIRSIYRGGTYWPQDISHANYDFEPFTPMPSTELTSREHEILRLIASGRTNRQVASTLSISTKTVENHRINLMAKLNTHSLPDLIRTSIKLGLIYYKDGDSTIGRDR